MGLRKLFSKSKAKSIEVNGVRYNAPEDGICSISVENGKVIINGKEVTKEIIEKTKESNEPKEIKKDGVYFERLNVTFNGVNDTEERGLVDADIETVDIDVNNYKFDDVMGLQISSRGDIEIRGDVKGSLYSKEGYVNVDGNVIVTGAIEAKDITVSKNIISSASSSNLPTVILNSGDLHVGGDVIGDIKFYSDESSDIEIKGNFKGYMKDAAKDEGWADIAVCGKAVGSIETTTHGTVYVGIK